jgi:hypothetical protein
MVGVTGFEPATPTSRTKCSGTIVVPAASCAAMHKDQGSRDSAHTSTSTGFSAVDRLYLKAGEFPDAQIHIVIHPFSSQHVASRRVLSQHRNSCDAAGLTQKPADIRRLSSGEKREAIEALEDVTGRPSRTLSADPSI